MTSSERVLAFWFGEPQDPAGLRPRPYWFAKDSAFDEQVRSRFLPLYEKAAEGGLAHWRAAAPSCLALVVVLDQFSRNMFRDTPRAFASDRAALETARHALEQGFNQVLPPIQSGFFYMAFEHSEDLDDQRRSVELFRAAPPHEKYDSSLDYAVRHMEIIERFGRFPHRNQILGRAGTAEEIAFLQQPKSGF